MFKKIRRKIKIFLRKLINSISFTSLSQKTGQSSDEVPYIMPGMPELLREVCADGIVLAKNNRDILPLDINDPISVFGTTQFNTMYVGYGSGGDVNPPYLVSFFDGLNYAGANYNKELSDVYRKWVTDPENEPEIGTWGDWPDCNPEMPIKNETIDKYCKNRETAVIMIGRRGGEDKDLKPKKGSYYLSKEEEDIFKVVLDRFKKVIVIINTGNIIDMSWMEEYGNKISALIFAFHGGMESGNSLCDVIYGKVCPSGRFTDTIPYDGLRQYRNEINIIKNRLIYGEKEFFGYRYYNNHPEECLYPIGHGLSYTYFDIKLIGVKEDDNSYIFKFNVKNIGKYPSKTSVLLKCSASFDEGNERDYIAGFTKTEMIDPGNETIAKVRVSFKYISVYDDERVIDVLPAGRYQFYIDGTEVEHTIEIYKERFVSSCYEIKTDKRSLIKRIIENRRKEILYTGNKGIKLIDVKEGRNTLEEFIAQFNDKQLEQFTHGDGSMNSPLGPSGNAGVFGGISEDLRELGVYPITCTDGPSGIRIRKYCSLLPCGTALASTLDNKLISRLYSKVAEEMKRVGSDVLLAPGMNLHRYPLNGRNFEYFSEDPVISGKMASAVVNGLQMNGIAAVPKHYACNNREAKRRILDSIVDNNSLRDIYLKNFEICVRESKPMMIMTSYNRVNGIWSQYNFELVTDILRNEWGFDGVVMTDWWAKNIKSNLFPYLTHNAHRIQAGVDLLMPGGSNFFRKKYKPDKKMLLDIGVRNGITRSELQNVARNVLKLELLLKYKDERN